MNWCSEHTQSVDLNYPPNTQSHPHNYLYGAIQWINKAGDGGAQKAYYVGITAEGKQPTMGNIAANGDIGQYVNLDEVLVLVMVIGDTAYPAGGGTNSSAQAFLANRAYAFERKDTSANFVLVKQFSQTIADGDIIALSLVGNGSGTAPKSIEYYYRANGSNEYQQEIVPSVSQSRSLAI